MTPRFADPDTRAIPIHIVPKETAKEWLAGSTEFVAQWAKTNAFSGNLGQVLRIPKPDGDLDMVLMGWGTAADHARTRFAAARAATHLHLARQTPPGGSVCQLPVKPQDHHTAPRSRQRRR